MTFRTAAPKRTGGAARRLLAPALLLLPAASLPASAQKPADILNKMRALYNNAKTYRGTVAVRQSNKTPDGKTFAATSTLAVSFQGPNRFRVEARTSGTAPVPRPGATREKPAFDIKPISTSQTTVSDGKTMYIYVPQRKMYAKPPVPPKAPLTELLLLKFGDKTPNARMLPGKKVHGRDAHAIEVRVELPANMPAQQRALTKPTFMAYVDRQNYQLLRIEGQGGTIDYSGQTFNAALPASAFQWSPPAGAKEFKPQPSQPGAPGGPGIPQR